MTREKFSFLFATILPCFIFVIFTMKYWLESKLAIGIVIVLVAFTFLKLLEKENKDE